MQNDKVLSFAELLSTATDQGAWVNGAFEALVGNARDGNGRQPNKADIFDPRDTSVRAVVAMFGGTFRQFEGRLCRFSGNGTKAKLYNGNVDVTVGKNGRIDIVGDGGAVPAATAPAPRAAAPAGASAAAPAPATRTQASAIAPTATAAEAEAAFHKELKKICLLVMHADQYLCDTVERIEATLPEGEHLTPERVQSLGTSIFMTAKERGLLARPPRLREIGDDGMPLPFIAPAKAADPAAEAKGKEEAERKRKEEEAHRAEQERLNREKEELDQDVPFNLPRYRDAA